MNLSLLEPVYCSEKTVFENLAVLLVKGPVQGRAGEGPEQVVAVRTACGGRGGGQG